MVDIAWARPFRLEKFANIPILERSYLFGEYRQSEECGMPENGPIPDESASRSLSRQIGGSAKVELLPSLKEPTAVPDALRSASDPADFLAGAKLLIVEDEFLIAQDLAHGPQREGISVLGPCNTIDSAIDVLNNTHDIAAAILDLNIRGHVVFDLAEQLTAKEIPFVFYTGYESVIVPEEFRKIRRIRKPAQWPEIKRALCGIAAQAAPVGIRLVKELSADAPDLLSLMPVISLRAREITPTPEMAELLVERTLERAIREIDACPAGTPTEHWLIGLLETTGIGEPRHVH